MSSKTTNIATSPGGSDILQETTPLVEQGSSVESNANSKTAGVPSKAQVGTHVSALRCDSTASETGKQMDSTELTGTEFERERMTSSGNCNKQEGEMGKTAGKERNEASKNDHQSTSTPIGASNSRVEREHKRTINLAVLNESELLNMIKGYVNSMNDFSKKTQNVHRVLKDTLTNTGLVLNQ